MQSDSVSRSFCNFSIFSSKLSRNFSDSCSQSSAVRVRSFGKESSSSFIWGTVYKFLCRYDKADSSNLRALKSPMAPPHFDLIELIRYHHKNGSLIQVDLYDAITLQWKFLILKKALI